MLLILGHQATISSVWWPIGFLWFRSGPQKLARATCFYQFYFRVKTLVKMETSEPSDTCELKTPDTSNCDSNCEKESLAHSGKRIQRKRIFLSQPVKSAFQTEIYLPPSKVNKQLFSSPPCTPVTLPTLHTPVTLPNSMPALMENQGKRIVRRRIFG